MVMSAQQVQAELQRKKSLGIAPTNAANMAAYNSLPKPATAQASGLGMAAKPASPKPATPPAGQLGVRQYLTNQGVNNADIGYNNGQVTVKGLGFAAPTSNVNGTSYATPDSLDSAWRKYQMNQGTQKVNGLLGDVEKAIDTPYAPYAAAQPFAYNKDTDPAYQAALQSAMANAQTAQNNALVGLGSRGIGNSSSAVTAANQIQQNALGAVTRDVLPQLISQAYQRYADTENQRYQQYLDQYGMSQDRIGNLGNLLGMQSGQNQLLSAEDQRAIDNAQTQWQNRFDYGNAIGTFGNGQQTLAGKQFNSSEDQRGLDNQFRDKQYNRGVFESDRGYNRGVFESDRGYNRGVYESDRGFRQSQSNTASDNSRASSSQSFNQKMDIWKATGVAPDGIAGVQKGTPWGGDTGQPQNYDYRTDPNFADDVAAITSNPDTALAEVQKNAKQIINTYGYDAYQELLKLATPKE